MRLLQTRYRCRRICVTGCRDTACRPSDTRPARVGQQVAAGDVLGQEGSTGDSTGPHLHFEVHEGSLWNQIDPAPWLAERGIVTGC